MCYVFQPLTGSNGRSSGNIKLSEIPQALIIQNTT